MHAAQRYMDCPVAFFNVAVYTSFSAIQQRCQVVSTRSKERSCNCWWSCIGRPMLISIPKWSEKSTAAHALSMQVAIAVPSKLLEQQTCWLAVLARAGKPFGAWLARRSIAQPLDTRLSSLTIIMCASAPAAEISLRNVMFLIAKLSFAYNKMCLQMLRASQHLCDSCKPPSEIQLPSCRREASKFEALKRKEKETLMLSV